MHNQKTFKGIGQLAPSLGDSRISPAHFGKFDLAGHRRRPAAVRITASDGLAPSRCATAWSTYGTTYFNDLLPVPYTAATVTRVADHIDQVQGAIGCQLLLENRRPISFSGINDERNVVPRGVGSAHRVRLVARHQQRVRFAPTIDLMIGRLPTTTAAEDTVVEVLFNDRSFVVAGLQSRWTRRRKIKLSELVNEPWCLPPPESFPGSRMANAFRTHGVEVPRASVMAGSIQLTNTLLSIGRFLTMLPWSMLHFSASRLSLKILPVELPNRPWPVGIVMLKNRTLSPVAQLFVNCAREIAKPLAKIG